MQTQTPEGTANEPDDKNLGLAADAQGGGDEVPTLKNTRQTRQRIKAMQRRVKELKAEREQTQAAINEQYSTAAAEGIPKEAFKRAQKDADLDEAQRMALDFGTLVCREAMGVPLAFDAFMDRKSMQALAERLQAAIEAPNQ